MISENQQPIDFHTPHLKKMLGEDVKRLYIQYSLFASEDTLGHQGPQNWLCPPGWACAALVPLEVYPLL